MGELIPPSLLPPRSPRAEAVGRALLQVLLCPSPCHGWGLAAAHSSMAASLGLGKTCGITEPSHGRVVCPKRELGAVGAPGLGEAPALPLLVGRQPRLSPAPVPCVPLTQHKCWLAAWTSSRPRVWLQGPALLPLQLESLCSQLCRATLSLLLQPPRLCHAQHGSSTQRWLGHCHGQDQAHRLLAEL